MTHNPFSCELCIAGREDLCKIREKTVSDFVQINQKTGLFKDFVNTKNKTSPKIKLPENRSPI